MLVGVYCGALLFIIHIKIVVLSPYVLPEDMAVYVLLLKVLSAAVDFEVGTNIIFVSFPCSLASASDGLKQLGCGTPVRYTVQQQH